MIRLALILGLAFAAPAVLLARGSLAPVEVARGASLDEILDAIRFVETGPRSRDGRCAEGDGGGAIGPFQIHRAFFEDSGVGGSYADCRGEEFARRVVIAYWQRWCPGALERRDAEVLARVHNGGPRGASKPATVRFWRKVERELEQSQR